MAITLPTNWIFNPFNYTPAIESAEWIQAQLHLEIGIIELFKEYHYLDQRHLVSNADIASNLVDAAYSAVSLFHLHVANFQQHGIPMAAHRFVWQLKSWKVILDKINSTSFENWAGNQNYQKINSNPPAPQDEAAFEDSVKDLRAEVALLREQMSKLQDAMQERKKKDRTAKLDPDEIKAGRAAKGVYDARAAVLKKKVDERKEAEYYFGVNGRLQEIRNHIASLNLLLPLLEPWFVTTRNFRPYQAQYYTDNYMPVEPMHELLGQVYIFAKFHQNNASIDNPLLVREILRGMMTATPTPTEDPTPFKDPDSGKKYGIPECILATRLSGGADISTFMLGSTAAAWPDDLKKVLTAKRKERMNADLPFANLPFADNIDLTAEIESRFRATDRDFVAKIAEATFNLTENNTAGGKKAEGRSRMVVNWYMSARQASTKQSWKSFNHQNQTGMSYMVLPGYRQKVLRQQFNFQWFEPVPRCMKCRIIHAYTVPDIEGQGDMDNYLTCNPILNCAEDLVHIKLRMFRPSDSVPDVIYPPNEAELQDPVDNQDPTISGREAADIINGKRVTGRAAAIENLHKVMTPFRDLTLYKQDVWP